MTFDKQRDEMTIKHTEESAARAADTVDQSRRRFTKSGVTASGVLFTLSSPSVMATARTAKSPSGFVSGNTSRGTDQISYGRSPGYWKNHTKNWPIPTSVMFKKVFSCYNSSPYAKYTLLQLLTPQKDDKEKLGMHLVAALLNAMMGWTPFLPEERIRRMFSEWQATGYFSPSPAVKWNAEQIVAYLKATQG